MNDNQETVDSGEAVRRSDELADRYKDACLQGCRPPVAEFLAAAGADPGALPELVKRLEQVAAAFHAGNVASTVAPVDFARQTTDSCLPNDNTPPPLPDPSLAPPGYVIERELGRGGMGVVYLARQVAADRRVALKMLLAGEYASPVQLARFRAEAAAAARLQHPNVAQVFEAGEHLGLPFFSLEYCPGGSLAKSLAGTPLPAAAAARLVATLADAVGAAHAAGVIHRDIKPQNVLLAADGAPKVADFGLAKRIDLPDGATRTGAVMGTPSYMAPEQADGRGREAGPPADIYALGTVLYEALTGRPPFKAASTWDTMRQVIEDEPAAPSTLVSRLPRDIETICLKCLQKDPARRYSSARALGDDLRAFLDGRPIAARPVGPARRAVRWARRRPVSALLFGLVTALVVGGPPTFILVKARFDQASAVATEADKSRTAAEKAREAAEELARVRGVFALTTKIRHQTLVRPVGWTAEVNADLGEAAALGIDPAARVELRSAACEALTGYDLRPLPAWPVPLHAAAAARAPDGNTLALAEFKGWLSVRVVLADLTTGAVTRTLSFSATPLKGRGAAPVQDGGRALAFSPDGRRLYAASRGGRVHRFDLDRPDASPAMSWTGGPGSLHRLVVSRDGKAVFVAGPDGVRKFDPESGREVAAAPEKGEVGDLALIPGSDELVVMLPEGPARMNPGTLEVRKPAVPVPEAGSVLAAPDCAARFLVASLQTRPVVVDPYDVTPTLRGADPEPAATAKVRKLACLALDPTGELIAGATDESQDRRVRVWETATGRLIGSVPIPGHTGTVCLAWGPGGRVVHATCPGQLFRLEVLRPAAQTAPVLYPQPVRAAAFAADGEGLLTLRQPPTELLHDRYLVSLLAADGREHADMFTVHRAGPHGGRPSVSPHPDGDRVAVTTGRPDVVFWRPGTGPLPERIADASPSALQFAPDGKVLWGVFGSERVEAHVPDGRNRLAGWSNAGSVILSGRSSLTSLACGRNLVAVGASDGMVYLLGPDAKKRAAFGRAGDSVEAVAVSPSGDLLLAGTRTGLLRFVWPMGDQPTEGREAPAHDGPLTAVAFRPGGNLFATGGQDRTVRFWRRDGEFMELLAAVGPLSAPVQELRFDPKGRKLLVLVTAELTPRVWDVEMLEARWNALGLGVEQENHGR